MKELKRDDHCEILTSWKEIPIRVSLPIRWVSPQERFVSFDFKECKLKSVFGNAPIYLKFNELFILCRLFSNVRDELVLEVEAPVPAPSIVLREFIRVEPTEKEPVYVSFRMDEGFSIRTKAADVSESGIGLYLSKDDAKALLDTIVGIPEYGEKIHMPFELEIELPQEGLIRAEGELKNVLSKEDELYVRFGFKIRLDENQAKKIRRYVMKRQREILEQLKSL